MSNRVTLLTGPARCGKTERLLAGYRAALARQAPGSTLWLAPTQRSAADIRGRLLNADLPVCLAPGVMTFAQFAESVLAASPAIVRPLSAILKRQLLRRLIATKHAAGRLTHFAPIADTPGLVDLFDQFISELKRQEIWPEDFQKACQRRGLSQKDRELGAVYQAYQNCLQKYQLYDAEGRFWTARQLLREGQRQPFDRLELVVVDGFTDFTRPQHEILEVLAERSAELLVSLPLDPARDRPDLFYKPQKTCAELQRRHPMATVETLPRRTPAAWPALDHLERHVFANPRLKVNAPSVEGIEVLPASRQVGEVETLARRTKELLSGCSAAAPGQIVAPGEIAVVFRNLADYAPLVREVFDRYGIPTAIEAGRRLSDSRALLALVLVLELANLDWPYDRLLAVLNHNYFRPDWPECDWSARLAAERTVRELQVPEGKQVLIDRIQRWARLDAKGREKPLDGLEAEQAQRIIARRPRAGQGLAVFARLAAALDTLPAATTPGGWSDAIERLATDLGLKRAIAAADVPAAMAGLDKNAWTRLQETLSGIDELCQRLGERPPQLDLPAFLKLLRDILNAEQLPGSHDETGLVRVLTAASVRSLSVPHLFLAGLSERSFPPPASDNRLYGEAEVEQLNQAGLPLVLRGERGSEEMLLFYEAFTRATQRLYLSYPALDEKAQPLLPSPYLADLERACGENPIPRTSNPELSPLPRTEQPLSATDFRLLAVDRALKDEDHLLAALVRNSPADLAEGVLLGLELTHQRGDRQRFGIYEGIVDGKAARAELAAMFGPDQVWSASNLEAYATCPYRFFAQRVLRLEPLDDIGLATDYGQRGNRAHDVLAWLHRELNRTGKLPTDLDAAEFARLRDEALAALMSYPDDEDTLFNALLEIDRRIIDLWTRKYPEQHAKFNDEWKDDWQPRPMPKYFEASFGQSPKSSDPISSESPLELKIGKETVKLAGRIDRIDIGNIQGRPAFVIVDYKSSSKVSGPGKGERAIDGTALQLELYAIAAQEVLLAEFKAVAWQGGYWGIRGAGFKKWIDCHRTEAGKLVPTEEWQRVRQLVEQKVAEIIHGIRHGDFPVHSLDDNCTGQCPYNTICRVNQIRSLEKTWPTTTTSPA